MKEEFVVNDRRHWALSEEEKQAKRAAAEQQQAAELEAKEIAAADDSSEDGEQKDEVKPEGTAGWKSVGYVVVLGNGGQGGMMVVGRAMGMRESGEAFSADWLFSPIWREGFDWTKYAKKRLDTLLACKCDNAGNVCDVHRRSIKQWMEQDIQRLNNIARDPVPEAVEVMMKAEHERQNSKIVRPR